MSLSTHTRLLRGAGILLVLLGFVHLVASPHISELIRHVASPKAATVLIPPMLFNHVLVGVLLLPLGYFTFYAAPHAGTDELWARTIVRTTALTTAAMPVLLVALMGTRYFNAPLFVAGTALVVAAAVLLLWAAFTRPSKGSS